MLDVVAMPVDQGSTGRVRRYRDRRRRGVRVVVVVEIDDDDLAALVTAGHLVVTDGSVTKADISTAIRQAIHVQRT